MPGINCKVLHVLTLVLLSMENSVVCISTAAVVIQARLSGSKREEQVLGMAQFV